MCQLLAIIEFQQVSRYVLTKPLQFKIQQLIYQRIVQRMMCYKEKALSWKLPIIVHSQTNLIMTLKAWCLCCCYIILLLVYIQLATCRWSSHALTLLCVLWVFTISIYIWLLYNHPAYTQQVSASINNDTQLFCFLCKLNVFLGKRQTSL